MCALASKTFSVSHFRRLWAFFVSQELQRLRPAGDTGPPLDVKTYFFPPRNPAESANGTVCASSQAASIANADVPVSGLMSVVTAKKLSLFMTP